MLSYIKESDPQGDWPNWVYCRGEKKEGWVPRQILDIRLEMVVVLDDYSAREHVLSSGDIFIAEKRLNGWIWGYKESEPDLPGWAPLNCLELI